MIRELVEKNGDHPELTDDLDWFILPVANPDGYVYSMSSGEKRASLDF
jgi:murein tripeptide amidase MpaA